MRSRNQLHALPKTLTKVHTFAGTYQRLECQMRLMQQLDWCLLGRDPYGRSQLESGASPLSWTGVAPTKLAVEKVQRHCIDHPRGSRVVASSFVPHKGMGGVEFVPGEICFCVGQRIVNR
jgi:hypothetical protein